LIEAGVRWGVPSLTGLYFLGGIAPPLFAQAGVGELAKSVSLLYAHFCHQIPERSFVINGVQFGFCARCTGFYGALFAASLLLSLLPRPVPPTWKIALTLLIPITLDFGFDLSASLPYPNIFRMATGLVGGLGIVLLLFPWFLAAVVRHRIP
jgi:uncharacterized membrane protein